MIINNCVGTKLMGTVAYTFSIQICKYEHITLTSGTHG